MLAKRETSAELQQSPDKLTVYYDGACPKCIRDRESYEKLAGSAVEQICWFDITGQDNLLRELGIDPQKALSELHVRDVDGQIASELDAYILLLKKVPKLEFISWLIGMPLIKPLLAKIYHWQVNRRLRKRGLRSV